MLGGDRWEVWQQLATIPGLVQRGKSRTFQRLDWCRAVCMSIHWTRVWVLRLLRKWHCSATPRIAAVRPCSRVRTMAFGKRK